MIPDADDRIEKLNSFLQLLDEWGRTHSDGVRARINQTKNSVQREVVEAGCIYTMTISPPPAVGGMIMQNVNPFDMIFQQVYLQSLNSHVREADSTAKCNIGESRCGIEEHFMGCSVAQRFSWPMIESVHDEVNLLIGDRIKPSALGNVLPHQAIGVFVQASLP